MIATIITTVIMGLVLGLYALVTWMFVQTIKSDLKVEKLTWFVWLVCASAAMPVVTLALKLISAGLGLLIG